MTDTLATEVPTPDPHPAPAHASTLLESWGGNERMRHIPRLSWMIEKADGDVRRRIEAATAAIERSAADAPCRPEADAVLRTLCRALEHLAEVAKHNRGALHPPNELGRHVAWSLAHAVASMRSADDDLIGRRYPFQTLERSKSEPLYGAFLRVLDATHRLVDAARAFDPDLDALLNEGLVHLEQPLRENPIA